MTNEEIDARLKEIEAIWKKEADDKKPQKEFDFPLTK